MFFNAKSNKSCSDEPLSTTKSKYGNKMKKRTNKNQISNNTENGEKYEEKQRIVRLTRSSFLASNSNETPEENLEKVRTPKKGGSQKNNFCSTSITKNFSKKFQFTKHNALLNKLKSAGQNKRIRKNSNSYSTNCFESSHDSSCDDQASYAKDDNINIRSQTSRKNKDLMTQNDITNEVEKENLLTHIHYKTVEEDINANSIKLFNEIKNPNDVLKENNCKDTIYKSKEQIIRTLENKPQKINLNTSTSSIEDEDLDEEQNSPGCDSSRNPYQNSELNQGKEKNLDIEDNDNTITRRENIIYPDNEANNNSNNEKGEDVSDGGDGYSSDEIIKFKKKRITKNEMSSSSSSSSSDSQNDAETEQNKQIQPHLPATSSSSSSSSSSSETEEEKVIRKRKIIKRRSGRKKNKISGSEESPEEKFDDSKDSQAKKKKTTKRKRIKANSDTTDDGEDGTKKYQKVIRKRKIIKRRSGRKKNKISASEESPEEKFDDSKDSQAKKKKKTTKRKRIEADSDTSDDDDDDEDGTKKFKRKNIRKIIKTQSLNFGTKCAAEEEKERRKRIEERQKLYNIFYEKQETTAINELVLDFDKETKIALLKVDPGLLKQLKPHQISGVKFMWDACFETIKESAEGVGSGCILAHCMGLGKTLQIITLTHTLITNSERTGVKRVLIITPLSTLTNWAREFQHWLQYCKDSNIEVYNMSKFKDKNTRTFKLNEWHEEGGVCIIGYDMYRILSNENTKGLKQNQKEILQKVLVDPGPDLVVCDEGHLLKNEKTNLSQAVNKMRTRQRIVLTGTPLQNNLKEYYCMIQFIKPNLLGTYREYMNRFANPITNGQYIDSTEHDIRLMKHRSHILHKLLEACIQRRDYSVLAPYLPPKHEYVVYITLSEIQKTIYEYYMTKQRSEFVESTGKGTGLFRDFLNLRRILTHPMCLKVKSDIVLKKQISKNASDGEESLKDFIVDNTESESSASSSEVSFRSDKSFEIGQTKKFKTRAAKKNDSDIEEVPLEPKQDPPEWWCAMVPKEAINDLNNSSKLVLLMSILRRCEEIGDKLLLFSQSLESLDVIEEFLSKIDKNTKGEEIEGNVKNFQGSWKPGIDYFRLDGSCSVESRELMCNRFNNITNLRARLFLISTRAGSLGINLVAANRVIIFDVSWNPSHDTQSIFRVYRFGQNKPCYIYRFIAMGTMEQKVYERQVTKQATAKRVIDEQQIERHYNQNDLFELYSYELTPKNPRETPILPKDRLFAEILTTYDKLVYKYHEHDSLLENKVEDNLSEEDRKAAWDEYEIVKANRPTPKTPKTPTNIGKQIKNNEGTPTNIGNQIKNNECTPTNIGNQIKNNECDQSDILTVTTEYNQENQN